MNCDLHERSCIDNVSIFSGLTKEEKDEIFSISHHKTYNRGDIVYSAGEKKEQLFIVHQGKIKISRISSDGKEQVIRILTNGDFMGELSLFSGEPMSDYAEVLEKTSICMIDGKELKTYMMKHPEIAFKIIEELSTRLEIAEELIEGINLHSVEWRLAHVLLKRANKNGIVLINTTKGNFASQLGMSQETLSRKLALFEDKKWIKQLTMRKILILDRNALSELL
ncbi:MAG TPA: Crp/Fnr family transcriptional regulator [Acholeplasmataceae bacterium]|nr:Crp/Fnr family transcriptional regulator [Acholeplasmataceae bacterium]